MASALVEAEETSWQQQLAKVVAGDNGGDRYFYFPTKDEPYTPAKYGYRFEDVKFRSGDGVQLHGWFLPATGGARKAKGTVVYSHGNAGSLAHHLGFVYWLMGQKYNVFMYDYRGYGKSGGVVSKAGLVEDVKAAFRYIGSRQDIDRNKLISMGHSLGGAKSIAALAELAPKGLKGIIILSSFASYLDMAQVFAGDAGRSIVTDSYEPYIYAKRLPKVPILQIHGTQDATVPVSQGKKLYAALNHPKSFLEVPDAQHCNCLSASRQKNRDAVVTWLQKALK